LYCYCDCDIVIVVIVVTVVIVVVYLFPLSLTTTFAVVIIVAAVIIVDAVTNAVIFCILCLVVKKIYIGWSTQWDVVKGKPPKLPNPVFFQEKFGSVIQIRCPTKQISQ
jgi:hypothetical protein